MTITYFKDDIPCVEIESLLREGERLAAERSSALQRQAIAVNIGDVGGALEAAKIARNASVRISTGQALLEVMGAGRIQVWTDLIPSSDILLFLLGQSYSLRADSYDVFSGRATSYKRLRSPYKVWFGGIKKDWGALDTVAVNDDQLDRSGGYFDWDWQVLVPHMKMIWKNDKLIDCGSSGQRHCIAFDQDSLRVDLPVDDYCRGARNGGDYEIFRVETEYLIQSLNPEKFAVTRRFGFRLPVDAESQDIEQKLLDSTLKDLIVSVLGSDQSYRVSDAVIAPLVSSSFDIDKVRQALNKVNDRAASSNAPITDDQLFSRFKDPSRYTGVSGGLVAFTIESGAGAVEMTFSRSTKQVRLERIRLKGQVLY